MPVIALTGGIATGKSTVSGLLAARGAVIVDADLLAREVIAEGTEGLDEVMAQFGDGVLGADGRLDRERLGAIVFADAGKRRTLEAITHPRIRALTATRVATALESDSPLVVVDIPLLFETGREADFPSVLLVYANRESQLRRLRLRDRLDEGEARRRMAAQLPIDDKCARATWIIDNSGTPEATAAEVACWWASNVGGQPE